MSETINETNPKVESNDDVDMLAMFDLSKKKKKKSKKVGLCDMYIYGGGGCWWVYLFTVLMSLYIKSIYYIYIVKLV